MMTAKLSLFVVCCFALPFSAFAQPMNASTLRAKYGDPLARETFRLRPNIEAIVSYGSGRQVCRIELPAGSDRNVVGEEIGRHIMASGRISFAAADYENVSISEPQDPDHPGQRTGVMIIFNRPDCH